MGSPLSAAATFTPAESTTVANLRAFLAMRDALRAADALAASIMEKTKVEEEDDGYVGTSTNPCGVYAFPGCTDPCMAANEGASIPFRSAFSPLMYLQLKGSVTVFDTEGVRTQDTTGTSVNEKNRKETSYFPRDLPH